MNMYQQKKQKKTFSIILRNPEEKEHRKGVNSMGLINTQKSTLLFTGSRDRYIKLWDINYQSKEANLKVNYDEHTDWVTQVLISKDQNLMFSCSNDTTIKMYNLRNLNLKEGVQTMKSYHTLDDCTDYVRAIDYSQINHTLYAISDNGYIKFWDLDKFQPKEMEEQKNEIEQKGVNSFDLEHNETVISTCLSCSEEGNILVVGFTDDKIKLYDMRSKGDELEILLQGGHTNTCKAIKLSNDGQVCYSVGADNSMRVWDIGLRKCIKTYQNQQKKKQVQNIQPEFHNDSIWALETNKNFNYAYTGGKDGHIFQIDIVNEGYKQLLIGNEKSPIISLKLDEVNNKLWYSTPDSSINCLNINTKEIGQIQNLHYMQINGLPWITNYYVFPSNRYILTDDSNKTPRLWSVEDLREIKSWKSKDFQQVKTMLEKELKQINN